MLVRRLLYSSCDRAHHISGGLEFRAEYELVDVSEGDFQIVPAG